jgi:hypothetical protein
MEDGPPSNPRAREDMKEMKIKVTTHEGAEIEILGPTYDDGAPKGPDPWRGKLKTREDMLMYLRTAERYWSGEEGFGSEKRKTPA